MSSPDRKEPLDTVKPQTEGASPLEKLSKFWSSLTARCNDEHNGEGSHLAFFQRLKKIASPTVAPQETSKGSSEQVESVPPSPTETEPRQDSTSETMAEAGHAVKQAFCELGRAFSITARVTSQAVAKSEGMAKLGDAVKKGVNSLTEAAKSGARRFSSPAQQTETVAETPSQETPEKIEAPETVDLKAKTEALKQADREAQETTEKIDTEPQPRKRGRPRKTEAPEETKAPAKKRGRPRKTEAPADAKKTATAAKKKTSTVTKPSVAQARKSGTTKKKSETASQ